MNSRLGFPGLLLFAITLYSCQTYAFFGGTVLPSEFPEAVEPVLPGEAGSKGIVDEIRYYTEKGTPSSLHNSLDIIRSKNLGSTEFGRAMVRVNTSLLKTLYPAVQGDLPLQDPPIAHIYSRILRDAERGIYTPPHRNSQDYLEHVLPFLCFLVGEDDSNPDSGGRNFPAESYLSALPDLQRAEKLNGESVLAAFFIGIVYEHSGRPEDALVQYSKVWEEFPECFPAALGLARVLETLGRNREAERFLSDLVIDFPDNNQVKRQLALSYYNSGNWSRAEPAVAEILQKNSRDGEFVLMMAHIFVEQGQLIQAQAPLDIYAGINPNNRLYLFLRARVQAEVYNNRESALNYLRSILRISQTADAAYTEAAVYASRILMESFREQDQIEGRELLRRLLAVPNPPLEVVSLALRDAVRREAWTEARGYLSRLLEERRSTQDLIAAYTVEKEQGNNNAALSYARELYERDRSNQEGVIAYISALIDTGRRNEAAVLIDSRIDGIPGGMLKSRYFFFRSLTRSNEELKMGDLRSSLFENPRNLDALIAMFEIYHARRDERRAVYYLRQALALAPNDLRLKRYEAEYSD